MTQNHTLTVEVVEVQQAGDRTVVVAQLADGEIRQGMVLEQCNGFGKYRVAGVGFTPAEGHAIGRRAVTLQSLEGNPEVCVGDKLQAVVLSVR